MFKVYRLQEGISPVCCIGCQLSHHANYRGISDRHLAQTDRSPYASHRRQPLRSRPSSMLAPDWPESFAAVDLGDRCVRQPTPDGRWLV